MEHIKSKTIVYQTTDYKRFRSIEGNRGLNKRKIERIVKEIKSGNDILDEVPVLVKEAGKFLEVLDGQHRISIAQQLARPVHYIIHKRDMNMHSVAKVNSNVEKWTATDFINCYKKLGNKNYEQLEAFHNKYGINIGTSISMLSHGNSPVGGNTKALQEKFEQGLFEVKKLKEATQLAEICKQFELFPAWNTRNFILAITKVIGTNTCEMDILLTKFLKDPKKLESQGHHKGYLTNLETIYNVGNSKRRSIY